MKVSRQVSAISLRVLGLLLGLTASGFGQGAGSEYPMRRVADMFQPLSRPAEMIHVTAVLVLVISARHLFVRHRNIGLLRREISASGERRWN